MKKILFCYFHPVSLINYTPLDIGYIAALIKEHFSDDYDVKIAPLFFGNENFDFSSARGIADIENHKPDAVFFFLDNVYWSNFFALGRAKILVQELKNRNPDIFVGIQSYKIQSDEIEKILRSGLVDCIIKKNPESAFQKIDKILAKKEVGGVAYFDKENKNIHNCSEINSGFIQNLDYLPSPYLTGFFDDFLRAEQLKTSGNFMAYLYFSRGCVFSCYYCARSKKNERKISAFSAGRFYDEIEYLLKKFSIRKFLILDDSFLNPFLQTGEFLSEFKKRKNKNASLENISLIATARPEYLNEKTVAFLQDINVRWLQIGLQTVNPDLQKYMSRHFPLDGFKLISSLLHKADIKMHLDIIMGLPEDAVEYFKKTLDYALSLDSYSIQINQFYLNPKAFFSEQSEKYRIKKTTCRNDLFLPFVVEASGGVDEKYFREATDYVKKKIDEFPEIKWKLIAEQAHFVDNSIWDFL